MFFAPELFERSTKNIEIRGEKTDLWALGISLFYLSTGKYPFEEAKNNLMLLKELIVEKPINFDGIKNQQIKDLLIHMLNKDPAKRATLDDILKCPWVTKNNTEKINPNDVVNNMEEHQKGFGNIDRLIRSKALDRGATSRSLMHQKDEEN